MFTVAVHTRPFRGLVSSAGLCPIVCLAAACAGGGASPGAPATPVAAHSAIPAPRRPALSAGADTNDPSAYNGFASTRLRSHPEVAAAAFYWMQRLSPSAPLAYYGERVARLLSDRRLLRDYIDEDRRTLQSAVVLRLDSLQIRALTLDPFFPQFLDEQLIITYWINEVGRQARTQATGTSFASDDEIEAYVRHELQVSSDSATEAWLAYARGNYRLAASYWAVRLMRDSTDTHLMARRAKALFLAGQPDSARAQLQRALAAARRSDAKTMKYVYDSKVLWEYEVGWIDELQKHDSAARESYQRALVEDLSFYPAHLRLAYVALRSRDTTTAVTELQRAIEVKENDFETRLLLGVLLAARHQLPPASEQLRRAAEIEPWVAYTHFVLGNVRTEASDTQGAAAEYRRFLELAPRSDPNIPIARQRLTAAP